MSSQLLEGAEALAQACIAARCRFFAGYPMTPFTPLLEHMARLLPEHGGTCVNAESELEAIGMVWGAAATGARAATGSVGQGLSLMGESLAEAVLAELPMVVFNLARGQSDYFQATRGLGHGDTRMPVLAPASAPEAVDVVIEAFDLAEEWRTPVLVMGDFLLAHTWETVTIPSAVPERARPVWAVDGSSGGTGRSRLVTSLGFDKIGRPSPGQEAHFRAVAAKGAAMAGRLDRSVSSDCDDADVVVVAFGAPARFAAAAVAELRGDGLRVGLFRPVSLWPFPAAALVSAASGARAIVVFELNGGQMVDDVRLAVGSERHVTSIGGISHDPSGFGVGALLDAAEITRRLRAQLAEEAA